MSDEFDDHRDTLKALAEAIAEISEMPKMSHPASIALKYVIRIDHECAFFITTTSMSSLPKANCIPGSIFNRGAKKIAMAIGEKTTSAKDTIADKLAHTLCEEYHMDVDWDE